MPDVKTEKLEMGGKAFTALTVPLAKAPLVMVVSERDASVYLACGYVSVTASDKFGDMAAFVSGVKSVPEMLAAKIVNVSKKAEEAGAKEGMTGKAFLEAFG
ncbi:MAG: DUF1805 domain-containing protein [Candidatus Micrarchaeota archaeon]|nr:DUF1805 domain-containing protein [Candidatus Micrarchaeota archaeon]